jgi:hypothetical protein
VPAILNELGRLSYGQIAAPVGVAPLSRESGTQGTDAPFGAGAHRCARYCCHPSILRTPPGHGQSEEGGPGGLPAEAAHLSQRHARTVLPAVRSACAAVACLRPLVSSFGPRGNRPLERGCTRTCTLGPSVPQLTVCR